MADEKKMEEQIKDIACSKNLKSFQRNRYFYGKLLTVRDFEEEQRYFIEKQRLINRLIHGEGVVCGLKVEKVEDKSGFIRITPGVALDCCGREIVVPEPVEINLSKKISLEDFGDEETITRWVTIRYSACGKEPVPAYSAESSCEETCCYSRIMEGYEIEVVEEKPEECTSYGNGKICDVWSDLSKVNEYVNIWHQKCPAFEEKPLILAKIEVKKESDSIEINNIDNAIVKEEEFNKKLVYSNPRLYELINCVEKQEGPQGPKGDKGDRGPRGPKGEKGSPGPGLEEGLTYIQKISWKHNGEMKLNGFKKLWIQFSNKIKSESLNENTFLVAIKVPVTHSISDPQTETEIEILTYQLEYLKGNIKPSDNQTFSFLIDNGIQAYIKYLLNLLKEHESQQKIQVLIQIKCDFILDEKGRAVAGHHIAGKGKSGLWIKDKYNIPGGIFESWFYLVPE